MSLKEFLLSDKFRYNKHFNFFNMPLQLRFLVTFRKAQKSKSIFRFVYRIRLNHLRKRTGNEIFSHCSIGFGLYLGHIGPRYIHENATIGNNCNIAQNVTIGQENRGKRKGTPTIGNNVWIGANSVIVGKITIGDDVLIAPGSFVNFNVPSHSVVIGNPGVIKRKKNATKGYINNTYEIESYSSGHF